MTIFVFEKVSFIAARLGIGREPYREVSQSMSLKSSARAEV